MNTGLQTRCQNFYDNFLVIKKAGKLNGDSMNALSASLYVESGAAASEAHIKECKTIVKQNAGPFSNLRGIAEPVILAKMALADDPAAYLEKVQAVYQMVKKHSSFSGTFEVVLAVNLADKYELNEIEPVLNKTFDIYKMMNAKHPVLTDKEDLGLAGLMAAANLDADAICAEQETCYQMVKEHYAVSRNTPQRISQILALSPEPADAKVAKFFALAEACEKAGHKIKHGEELAILAAFVSLNMDCDEVAAQIGEVDDWLKDKKGFGALGVGQQLRRMFAGVLVLQENGAAYSDAATAVSQQVVITLIITLIMVMVIVCISSSAAASS